MRFARNCLVSLGMLLAAGGTAGAGELYKNYFSVINKARMSLDWESFYRAGDQKTDAVRAEYKYVADIAYGTDAKQVLDLYLPKGGGENRPVLLFIHGGSFLEGDKRHYGYLARPYLDNGVVVAVMSYRLTGQNVTFPGQLDDVKAALAWLHKNVKSHGGDPNALYVAGHSAGAVLAAEAGVDRSWMEGAGIDKSALKAIIAISGKYRLGPGEKVFPNYVPSRDAEDEASPILHLDDPAPRFLLVSGMREGHYMMPTVAFFEALERKSVPTDLMILDNHDHMDTANGLGDPASAIFIRSMELIRGK